jgi:hypothetical protein
MRQLFIYCAEKRRLRTTQEFIRMILSPLRLPVSPPGHMGNERSGTASARSAFRAGNRIAREAAAFDASTYCSVESRRARTTDCGYFRRRRPYGSIQRLSLEKVIFTLRHLSVRAN